MSGTGQPDLTIPARNAWWRALSLRRAPLLRIAASTLAAALAAAGAFAGVAAQAVTPMPSGQLAWTLFASASSGLFAFLTTMAGGYAIRAMRADPRAASVPVVSTIIRPLWGSLPPRNPHFTDRNDTLDLVQERLTDPASTANLDPASCVVIGLGGVGKTTIAAEFAYRHRSDYSVIWWIRADQEATIIEDLLSLARALHGGTIHDPVDVTASVRQGLVDRGPWLLIFDNAESQSDLRHFWPGGSAGSILLTSRNAVWEGLVGSAVTVGVLEQADATTLLQRRSGRLGDPSAAAVADQLGRLPLALAQAGSYVSTTKTSLQRYGQLIDEQAESVLRAGLPGDYASPVSTTWTVSFEAASKQSTGAGGLLALYSYLAASEIPRWLVPAQAEALPEPLKLVARDPVAYDLAIGALTQYSLLQTEEDSLSVHRLVQLTVRSSLPIEEQRTWAVVATTMLYRAFPHNPGDRSTWPLCGELIPHVISAVEHVHRLGLNSLETGHLLYRAGRYLVERGAYQDALDILKRAIEVLSATIAPDSLEVAAVCRAMATALLRTADLPNTVAMAERALSIHEHQLGPADPEVTADLLELGRVYREVSRLAESQSTLELALAQTEERYGAGSAETGPVLQTLASTIWRIGHLGKARALLEQALQAIDAGSGESLETEAAVHRTLATVARDLQDYALASHHLTRARELFVALDGPDSIMATRVDQTLSDVLTLAGVPAEAYDLITRTLEQLIAVYGADHPNVAEALRSEGMALNALGRPADAEPILKKSLAIYESTYEPDHPYLAGSLVPLAATYRLLGQEHLAAQTIERAGRIVVTSYGSSHPAYAAVAEELSHQRAAVGDHDAAAVLAAEAASIMSQASEWNQDA